jgi:hypothetical protein
MPNNTANGQPPSPTIRYAALATGPFVNTVTRTTYDDQVDAIEEAIGLMGDDEVYEVFTAKATVTINADGTPNVTIDLESYEGDEAQRIVDNADKKDSP